MRLNGGLLSAGTSEYVKQQKSEIMTTQLNYTKDERLNKVANMLVDPSYTDHNGGSLYYETGIYKWGYKGDVTKLLKRGWATIDTEHSTQREQEYSGVYFLRPTKKLQDLQKKLSK